MSINYIFLAEGFEEVEALQVVDIMRRAGIEVKIVSITGEKVVASSHGVKVEADVLMSEASFDNAGFLILPGGMPGSVNLRQCGELGELLKAHAAKGGKIAAICAAPMVLGALGLVEGKRATCYPGFEAELKGAEYTKSLVEHDGNIVTGIGPAAAMPFGFKIVELIAGAEKANDVAEGMLYNYLIK